MSDFENGWTWATIVVLALFGGWCHLWNTFTKETNRTDVIAIMSTALFTGVLVGLSLWKLLQKDYPTELMACTGAAGWLGRPLLNRLSARVLGDYLSGNGSKGSP